MIMTGEPQKEYIITEDGIGELDKYFIEHKDKLIKIAWKNLKDKHVCPHAVKSSEKVLEELENIIKQREKILNTGDAAHKYTLKTMHDKIEELRERERG